MSSSEQYNIKYLKYANEDAMKNNIIMKLLYIIAYPLVIIFIKYSIHPNIITSISLILAPLSLFFLLADEVVFYSIILFLSIILDFCDGSVARALNKVSGSAFNYDHMSDIVKISTVLTGIGIYYNTLLLWTLTSFTLIMFMLYNITHHDISYHEMKNHFTTSNKKNNKSKILSNIKVIIGTVNGHTWLGLLIITVNYKLAITFLIYINILFFLRGIKNIRVLLKTKLMEV